MQSGFHQFNCLTMIMVMISEIKKIMDEFGTMEDFDQLLDEVHNRGMD